MMVVDKHTNFFIIIYNNNNNISNLMDSIIQLYKEENFICSICLEYLTKEIYQCHLGPHFVCGVCNKDLIKCPICRNEEQLVRAIDLEQELYKYLIKCEYYTNGCREIIFEWDADHISKCKFRPVFCPVCNKKIYGKLINLIHHLTNGLCNFNFDKIQIEDTYTKFRCIIRSKLATLIEIKTQYIILIIPQFKDSNYNMIAISLNDELSYDKIKCKTIYNNISQNIVLPIVNYSRDHLEDFDKINNFVSVSITNFVFEFEDENLNKNVDSMDHKSFNYIRNLFENHLL
jgi:hypothetical protein